MKISRDIFFVVVTVVVCLWGAYGVNAKVSPEEAKQLKGNLLTPYGAERAGNKDGTIPAWTGGIKAPPPGLGYKGPGSTRPDPYAGDKVLFSITAKNVNQYADKLTEGQKLLLKKHPDTYRLDVYPTHRSEAQDQWVWDNTYDNATRAYLSEDNNKLYGAFGGIPFPIAKTAEELVWNHLLRNYGESGDVTPRIYVVLRDGSVSTGYTGFYTFYSAYYDREFTYDTYSKSDPTLNPFLYKLIDYRGPARSKGQLTVTNEVLNMPVRNVWTYYPGQRRVRRQPSLSYDNPDWDMNALACWDQIFVFNGGMERYNWKNLGRKEMYVPYNCYSSLVKTAPENVYHAGHPNPKYIRWELHRVYVIEAALKPGQRHIYARRVMYMDEDSYIFLLGDFYDSKGGLYRSTECLTMNAYELPGVEVQTDFHFDFQTDQYAVFMSYCEEPGVEKYQTWPKEKIDWFSAENLRRISTR